jgi:tRNA (cytidine/uridine-2'-O-)-methyltransferase
MFHVILYQPEIPPNTGNIIRLCANTGATLHLIHPLGFELDEPRLRRAGLDYRELAQIQEHQNLDACLAAIGTHRLFAFSTRGRTGSHAVEYRDGDAFLFGSETAGLTDEVLNRVPGSSVLRLPMAPGSRSLNLSNAVAVVVFEAWRQQGFAGAN